MNRLPRIAPTDNPYKPVLSTPLVAAARFAASSNSSARSYQVESILVAASAVTVERQRWHLERQHELGAGEQAAGAIACQPAAPAGH